MLAHLHADQLPAQIFFADYRGAVVQPRDGKDHEEGDSQVADDRIHAANQFLESHQRIRITCSGHPCQNNSHALIRAAGEASSC